jgi:hypothetical protein
MAVVKGIREKVHLPIYDSIKVEPKQQLKDVESTSIMKLFVNVQGKTKLETNLQSASLLPHYNTFEARALRVVISDLPPEYPDDVTGKMEELSVLDEEGLKYAPNGTKIVNGTADPVTATFEPSLERMMDLLKKARESEDKETTVDVDDDDVTLDPEPTNEGLAILVDVASVYITVAELEEALEDIEKSKGPPKVQYRANDGAGNVVSQFIYNTVTTLFVGEKIMIQMPTWFFPAGAGPYSDTGRILTHGEPNPTATFRFAEPIFIDRQQNFRVEIEVPDTVALKELQRIYGPFSIWVVLDGYMTRDVQ